MANYGSNDKPSPYPLKPGDTISSTGVIRRQYGVDKLTALMIEDRALAARAKIGGVDKSETKALDLATVPIADPKNPKKIPIYQGSDGDPIRVVGDDDAEPTSRGRAYARPSDRAVYTPINIVPTGPDGRVVERSHAEAEELDHINNQSATRTGDGDERAEASRKENPTVSSDSPSHYYVTGNRDERLSAMARAKQLVGRTATESSRERMSPHMRLMVGDFVKPEVVLDATKGTKMVDLVTKRENENLGYQEKAAERSRGGIEGGGAADIFQQGLQLHQKVERGEKLTPSEQEAYDDLSNPDVWDAVAKNGNRRTPPVAASKGGNAAGESKSSAVPKGHNPALDGYSGPRVVINPTTFKNEKDGLCVAFNEAFRILMEVNGFDPVAEPTEKQREFFSDTAYANDELQMKRTILARICTFDTSVTDPTDEQLQEAVEFLDTVLEIGAPQNQWEQRAVERIRTAIERSVGQPRTEEENPKPPAEGPAVAAAGGGETEEEALQRLAAGDTGKTLQEDTSTIEEREKFLEERGMDKSLAETGSMDTLIKMHEQRNGVPPADAAQTRPDAPVTDAKTDGKTDGKPALTNADVLASKDAVEFVAANGGGTTGNGISVDAGAKVMDDGRIIGSDGNARNADGKIDNFGRSGEMLAEMQQQANPVQEQHEQNSPQTASERTGTTSGIKGLGGRELTAGEAAWQARKQASTAAWMQRTGRSGDGVADALAQRDERANNLRQNS